MPEQFRMHVRGVVRRSSARRNSVTVYGDIVTEGSAVPSPGELATVRYERDPFSASFSASILEQNREEAVQDNLRQMMWAQVRNVLRHPITEGSLAGLEQIARHLRQELRNTYVTGPALPVPERHRTLPVDVHDHVIRAANARITDQIYAGMGMPARVAQGEPAQSSVSGRLMTSQEYARQMRESAAREEIFAERDETTPGNSANPVPETQGETDGRQPRNIRIREDASAPVEGADSS